MYTILWGEKENWNSTENEETLQGKRNFLTKQKLSKWPQKEAENLVKNHRRSGKTSRGFKGHLG